MDKFRDGAKRDDFIYPGTLDGIFRLLCLASGKLALVRPFC